VGVMAYHLLRKSFAVMSHSGVAMLFAVMTSVGVSALNEIMEFLIAVTVERNGVGGYENAMLDLIFNLSGAVVAVVTYVLISREQSELKN
jgi:glycopeptide antibiotics resistance protein